MTYRPYPSATRALHQLDRHGRTVPPTTVTGLEALNGWALTAQQALANASATLRLLPSARDLIAKVPGGTPQFSGSEAK